MRLLYVALAAALCGLCDAECPKLSSPQELRLSELGDGVQILNFTTQHYEAGLDCGWMVINDLPCETDNQMIELNWVNIDTEFWYDFVVLFDGDSVEGKRMGSFSGSSYPTDVIESSGPNLLIHFHSDMDKSGVDGGFEGFLLDYKGICGPPKPAAFPNCKDPKTPMLLSGNGVFNFTAENYKHGMQCGWLFQNLKENETCSNPNIELDFTSFSTEFSYDFVTLYTGEQVDAAEIIGRYSGPNIFDGPGYHRSEGSDSVLVTFSSDSSNNGGHVFEGFSVTYTSVCGERAHENCPVEANATVFTGSGPDFFVFGDDHYQNSLDCFWKFQNTNTSCSEGDPVVTMKFPHFHTEADFDVLTLYDGNSSSSPVVGGQSWSGFGPDANPGFRQSSGDTMLVRFTTDRNLVYAGFTILFDFVCASKVSTTGVCPSVTAPEVRPATGNFSMLDHHYHNNLDCAWVFTNNRTDCPLGSVPVVGLDFSRFHTEPVFDYIAIFEGTSVGDSSDYFTTKRFSGKHVWEVPQYVRSSTNSVTLQFHSDGSVNDTLGDDTMLAMVTSECSADDYPESSWNCSKDHLENFMHVNAGVTNPLVLYGHYAAPFSIGYPIAIEQAFKDPHPDSMLKHRGQAGVQAPIVFAQDYKEVDDGHGATMFCCAAIDPSVNVTGKILVCDRGQCLFTTKVRVAQAHGAVGMIAVDYNEDGVRMGSTNQTSVHDVTIPSMSVRNSFGVMLWKLQEQTAVTITMASYMCPGMPAPIPGPIPTAPPSSPTTGPVAPTADTPTVAPSTHDGSPTAAKPTAAPTTPPARQAFRMYFTIATSKGFVEDYRSQLEEAICRAFNFKPGSVKITSDVKTTAKDAEAVILSIDVYDDIEGQESARDLVMHAKELFDEGSVTILENEAFAFSLTAPVPKAGGCFHSSGGPKEAAEKANQCRPDVFTRTQWIPVYCECVKEWTALAYFVYVLLPIVGVLLLLLAVCCLKPGCWLHSRRARRTTFDEMEGFGEDMLDLEDMDSQGFAVGQPGKAQRVKAQLLAGGTSSVSRVQLADPDDVELHVGMGEGFSVADAAASPGAGNTNTNMDDSMSSEEEDGEEGIPGDDSSESSEPEETA